MVNQLIVTVTRRCNLRCSYCPTAKDGWPSLTPPDAARAVSLFCERFEGGDLKLFGGEPLLVPDVVRAVFSAARDEPKIRRVYLSTNGLGLNQEWLDFLRQEPKAILTLSMDGRPSDHRRLRQALPGVPDAYDHLMSLRDELVSMPRTVVTQTIAPSTARFAAENFEHLLSLGFSRFNFLPGYYVPWREEQLAALRTGFSDIASTIVERWRDGRFLYVRNLFTWAPTPFFNTGMIVDADGSIHPSNLGLSAGLADTLEETRVGSLVAPPTRAALEAKAREVNALLERRLAPEVWRSTLSADHELSRFCRGLYGDFLDYRRRRNAA
ncbi:MAG: radical SAM protein [Myxococcales bacterium]|nr:radical SAM protein [Myxococcales bacterium]MCB9578368.1 radical SAM protein [Polyangiaceae bacterium]